MPKKISRRKLGKYSLGTFYVKLGIKTQIWKTQRRIMNKETYGGLIKILQRILNKCTYKPDVATYLK
jgi:hypothetical protein